MKIQIVHSAKDAENTERETTIPAYFKSGDAYQAYVNETGPVINLGVYEDWSYEIRVSKNRLLHEDYKPCTQEEFVSAYATALQAIQAASGVEHLTLIMYDDTSNPES